MRPRFCLSGLASLLVALALPAGGSLAGPPGIGIKAGLSAASLRGDLPTDPLFPNGTRLGFGGGLALAVGLGSRLSLQPEVLYVMKGTTLGEVDITDENGNRVGRGEVVAAFDYLEIPVLARVSLTAGGPVAPYLLAGPAVAVRLSQRLVVTGEQGFASDLDFVKSADLGLALGVGLEIGRGRGRWTLETRYTQGLSVASESSYSDEARNGALLVMAGYALHP